MDLYLCSTSFQKIAIIDDYSSLVWTDRYTKHGDVKVVFDIDSPSLDAIKQNLYFSFTPSDSHMIIESLVTNYEKKTVTVVGRCLKTLFERRLNRNHVLQPSVIEESAAGAATKSVKDNCLDTPVVDDRFANVIVGDHYLPWGGGPSSIRDNGQKDVYSEIVSIVDEPLVGWKMEYRERYQHASGGVHYDKLVFHCYVGSDRTMGNTEGRGAVIFDPQLDNISDVSVVKSNELYKNVIAVRWGNNGTGWTYAKTGLYQVDNYRINRRVGLYTPEVSIEEIEGRLDNAMNAYGRAEAARCAPINVMDGTALSDGPFKYGWDYFMGDKVTIGYDKKTRQEARVIEYIWSNDENGWTHYPTFKIIEE